MDRRPASPNTSTRLAGDIAGFCYVACPGTYRSSVLRNGTSERNFPAPRTSGPSSSENSVTLGEIPHPPQETDSRADGRDQGTRPPKGFPKDHPADALLRAKQWYFYTTLDPAMATTKELLPALTTRFRAMREFNDFLNAPLLARTKRERLDPATFFAQS